ncbi:MAG: CoA transferase [Nitrospinae bacterium]|nr:CoA transferase [Nitrospinota bacterium]
MAENYPEEERTLSSMELEAGLAIEEAETDRSALEEVGARSQEKEDLRGPLEGLKILDLGLAGAGPFGPSLLAELGAEVVKVEIPGEGCTMRRMPPFYEGASFSKLVELRNKKSIEVDLHTAEGQALIRELVKEYDVVVENYRPGRLEGWGIGYEALKWANDRVILVRVSGFGQEGPYSHRTSYDTVGAAMGGLLHLTGYPDGPPLTPGLILCDYASAAFNALASLLAVYYREKTGRGQWADIAQYEAIFRFSEFNVAAYDKLGLVRNRTGNRHPSIAPGDLFETQDHQLLVIVADSEEGFARLCQAMGREELLRDPRFGTMAHRADHAEEINGIVGAWAKGHPLAGLTRTLEEAEVPFSPIYTVRDAVKDPHYQARQSFIEMEDPVMGRVKVPNLVPRLSETPGRIRDTGPTLGEHQREICSQLKRPHREERPAQSPSLSAPPDGEQVLAGLRVLELGPGLAGGFGATLLADFGAEVIKIEEPGVGDPLRHRPPFDQSHSLWWSVEGRNKRSLTLDLRKEKGREIFRRLVGLSDLVIESFRPGTLEAWGLGFEELKRLNPKLILVRVSGFGQSGPYRHRPSCDAVAAAFGGLTFCTGFPDGLPVKPSLSMAEYLAGLLAAISTLAALYRRQRSGKGQWVDLSLYEPLFRFSFRALPMYDKLGVLPERRGHSLPAAGVQVVYPTRDGKWVAILFPEDRHFARLCRAMGREELARDPRFDTIVKRRMENNELLSQIVVAWTRGMRAEELINLLEEHEIPTGLVYDIRDIFEDPHYRARGNILTVEDPALGSVKMQDVVPKLSLTPGKVRSAGPLLGQHNEEIYRNLLDFQGEELGGLREEGVI